ncbi:hypothetical protein EQG79_29025 [Spirosoma sordidisoli]|uniref:Uncharacterized protein n=1 Tax=Spirosoma sordidisoli TaxID=2502893 RepID=A0A4Q2UGT0_9BACT|nr:hypothetical protein EQG79_29025 [Spirosoma sordidisoli]
MWNSTIALTTQIKFVAPNRYPSECQITIYRQSGIVIATDIDKGMSRSAVAVKFDFGDSKHGPTGRFWNPNWTHIPPDGFKKMIQIAQET